MAQALVERLPAAELSVIEGLGKFFFIERPAPFPERAGRFRALVCRGDAYCWTFRCNGSTVL
jgi:hypothetical protein